MRRIILTICATVVGLVLLLGFKTHSSAPLASPPAATSGAGTTGGSSGSASPAPSAAPSSAASTGSSAGPATPSASASPSAATGTRTVTGDSVDTRYGPVQVQVTLTDGRIAQVTAVQYPDRDPVDQQINSYAIPQLGSEAVAADSGTIDMVSGATYTSEGYITSLQSALDKVRG